MEISYEFFLWFAGAACATYTTFSIALFRDRNMYNVPRRAFIALSCLMAYLVMLALRDVLLPVDHPFYHGCGIKTYLLENLMATPGTIFVIMELSHYHKVTFTRALTHLLPFIVMFFAYRCLVHFGLPGSDIIFFMFVAGTLVYMTYHMIVLTKAVKKFETELNQTYANSEGRALKWYPPLVIALILLILIFAVLLVVYQDDTALEFAHVAALAFWVSIAMNVRRMRQSPLIPDDEDNDADSMDDEIELSDIKGTEQEDEDASFLEHLTEVLNKNNLLYNEDLSREDVAREMGINHVIIAKTLKRITNMTFSEYVTDKRLSRAAHLLLTTSLGVEQILYSCGFRSRATFHRGFTKKYHCSPTDFRQGRTRVYQVGQQLILDTDLNE